MTASNDKFEKFNVGGVWLNQPFKIHRLGHFGFNLANMEDRDREVSGFGYQ
jgi:hypothetical protein